MFVESNTNTIEHRVGASHTAWLCGAVVLNYNGWRNTIDCIKSLLASDVRPTWIIIVDNASTDDSVSSLRSWAQKTEYTFYEDTDPNAILPKGSLLLLRASKNGGYAAGNNLGLRVLMANGADAFWILNNDVVVAHDAMQAMLERLFSKNRPGLCGARIYYTGTDKIQCRAGGVTCYWTALSTLDGNGASTAQALSELPEAIESRINFIYGACVMASRSFVESVGLMDERFFLYCEEQDWAYSAKGGFDFAYADRAVVWHKEGCSTGHSYRRANVKALLLLARSRLLLTRKHYPYALPIVAFSICFSALRMVWRKCLKKFCIPKLF